MSLPKRLASAVPRSVNGCRVRGEATDERIRQIVRGEIKRVLRVATESFE